MIVDAVRRAAMVNGNRVATICESRKRTWTEVADRCARMASLMRTIGVNAGDRVGILAANSDRYLETIFATWWLGAVIVPMNTRWSLAEHLYSIDDADIRASFTIPPKRRWRVIVQPSGHPFSVLSASMGIRL